VKDSVRVCNIVVIVVTAEDRTKALYLERFGFHSGVGVFLNAIFLHTLGPEKVLTEMKAACGPSLDGGSTPPRSTIHLGKTTCLDGGAPCPQLRREGST